MKFTIDAKKLVSALKGANVVFADSKAADAAVAAVESLLPSGEFLTEQEVDEKLHEAREQAKDARLLNEQLVERITGMKKDQFDEQNRRQKMLDAVDAKLKESEQNAKEYKEKYEPASKKLADYEKAEAERVKKDHAVVADRIRKVLSDEKNEKFKKRFVLPEEGNELSVEDMRRNIETFNTLREDGVPVFQDEEPASPEGDRRPGGKKTGDPDYANMTREQMLAERNKV